MRGASLSYNFAPGGKGRTRRPSPLSNNRPARPPGPPPRELTVRAAPAPGQQRGPAIVLGALSVTSTSKAVACAVISTAGNVTARPTAQTTTSARAMVSSEAAALLVLLRRPTGAQPRDGGRGGAGSASEPAAQDPGRVRGAGGGSSLPGPEGSAPEPREGRDEAAGAQRAPTGSDGSAGRPQRSRARPAGRSGPPRRAPATSPGGAARAPPARSLPWGLGGGRSLPPPPPAPRCPRPRPAGSPRG